MAGRGPAPKDPSDRRRRNNPAGGEWVPTEGEAGRAAGFSIENAVGGPLVTQGQPSLGQWGAPIGLPKSHGRGAEADQPDEPEGDKD